MKNKIIKYDFLIVGGGLVGSLAAIALFKKHYKVLVIDKNILLPNDNRTLAINANSRDFLKDLNLWEKLKTEEEPIQQIIIKDKINHENTVFKNNDQSMGSVIYNNSLLNLTREFLKKNKLIFLGIDFDSIDLTPKTPVFMKNKHFMFNKIILSLGKNYENFDLFKKITFKSHHRAYVGFFDHQKKHNQTAYEIFTSKGPLAVLPSPSPLKKTSTFIYSTKDQMNFFNLKKLIKENFQTSHGSIDLKPKIFSYPITPHLSKSLKKDFLILGDTSHSIHPVAGQGWNLGVKDIQTLCDNLLKYKIENPNFDNLYASNRILENISYLSFTSFLNSLYESNTPLSNQIIKTSFFFLNKFNLLKELFIKQAMGKLS